MERFAWVCLGGAVGTGLRYLVALAAERALGDALPFGTLIVNLVGCFVMGGIAQAALSGAIVSPTLRLALTTGLLGGLTTYSSFNQETTKLLQGGAPATGACYFGLTVIGCFACGLAGTAAARAAFGR